MITKITGKLTAVSTAVATLSVEAFEYQILIPEFVRRQLQSKLGENVQFHTIHYLEGNPAHGRLTPRLVGFTNVIEREFFEMFCSVDGVGAKKALRAMIRPVQDVATMIEEQDAKGLSTLPGIGPATGERIIAKLRRKMSKFALLASARYEEEGAEVEVNIVEETYQLLCTLGHSESESHRLIETVLEGKKKYKDVDKLLHAVYELSHGG